MRTVRYVRGVDSPSRKQLDAMVEQATVDCYNDAEQATGFFTMLEEHLAVPFDTQVLGVDVSVCAIDMTEHDQIIAVCSRGQLRQTIPILDLPLPEPTPTGVEWIDAYRYWRTRERRQS